MMIKRSDKINHLKILPLLLILLLSLTSLSPAQHSYPATILKVSDGDTILGGVPGAVIGGITGAVVGTILGKSCYSRADSNSGREGGDDKRSSSI